MKSLLALPTVSSLVPASSLIFPSSWRMDWLKLVKIVKVLKVRGCQSWTPSFFTQLSLKHKNIVNNFCMHVKIWCWWFGTPDWLRLVQNLDAATETLEAEYEKCDKIKLDVSSLRSNKGLPESTVTEFLEWKLVVNNTTNKSLDVWTKIVHNCLSMFLALSPTAHQVHSPGM